jgi:hypothetical protein
MFLKLFQGQQVTRGFSKKIHTQMCIASLFGRREHRKVEKNEWNDDDDEQKQIFYEEEKNSSLEKSKQQFKCDITKCSCLIHCNCENECMENKSKTYLIQYEGGVGIISK